MPDKTPYPSSHEIEDIFEWRGSLETMDKFAARVSPQVEMTIMGHDHHLSATHKGVDAVHEHNKGQALEFVDMNKGLKLDIIQVIGGGDSPWACVEMRTQAKAKSGKKWHHEFVYVVRFNLDGQITKIRAYLDTAHMNSHVDEHRNKVQKKA